MWLVMVTMTTVGYGDYFPQTVLGRIVLFLVCIWGLLIISLMVIAIVNILSLDELESKAFNVIQNLRGRLYLRKLAEFIFKILLKISLAIKGKRSKKNLADHSNVLAKYLTDFKKKKK
jgi:Ion channel